MKRNVKSLKIVPPQRGETLHKIVLKVNSPFPYPPSWTIPQDDNMGMEIQFPHGVPMDLKEVTPCVNLTIIVNPTKQESQRVQLQRYFLGCIYWPLQLISAQSNARARTRGRADT